MAVNNRINGRGGGVALYVFTSLNYKVISELSYMTDAMETLCVEIIVPNRRNIVVAVVYRPPNSNHDDFITSLHSIISPKYLRYRSSFIMGDFNINLLDDENQNLFCDKFLDTLSSQSFMPLINKSTQITKKTTASLLDNIFTNKYFQAISGIIISDISDHFPIYTHLPIFQLSKTQNGPNSGCRKLTGENIDKFKQSLRLLDWVEASASRDVNEAFDLFFDIFNRCYERYLPVQNTSKNSNYRKTPRSPWITTSPINRKNRLLYKFKSKPTESNKNKYTTYKKTLVSILRYAKKDYFSKQFEFHRNGIKNTY